MYDVPINYQMILALSLLTLEMTLPAVYSAQGPWFKDPFI